MFVMFPAHTLCEWEWPHAHMNVTTFAQNCNVGSLVVLYGSTVHVALYPGTIPSFAVLHTEKLAIQCATKLSTMFQTIFFLLSLLVP